MWRQTINNVMMMNVSVYSKIKENHVSLKFIEESSWNQIGRILSIPRSYRLRRQIFSLA